MKTTLHSLDAPLDGDERLMDALLREHARVGTNADEAFLTRLSNSLDAQANSANSANSAILPATPIQKRPAHRLAWSLGLAASVALSAGLIWKNPLASKAPHAQVSELARGSGTPLCTGMPPELIEGTPKPISLPNLVPVPEKVPVFFVPQGTTLLSKGGKVTSSDDNPIIGTLDLITDGDKQAGEGYFVELLDGLQWVQIDLEKSAAIHAIWVWHYHSQRRAYHDVIVRISDDPEFKTGVTTVYNNDYDNSAKLGRASDNPYVESRYGLIVDGKGTTGRYVRLYSNGNSSNEMNHYIEVEVFGLSN
jgi:hypothetical protein